MQFAVMVPNWAPYDQDLMIRIAREAEDLGFDYYFITDHLMNPYGPRMNLPELTVEVWSLLSYLAAQTSRINLCTSVTPISLRPPAILAKQVATLDNLARGRVILGYGAGWHQPEYDAFSDFGTPRTRRERMVEGLDLMIRLWTEDEVTFQGKYYSTTKAVIAPKPVQKPYPRLWLGAFRPRMLEAGGRFADGWIPWNRPLSVWKESKALLEQAALRHGRAGKVVYGAGVLILPDRLRNEKFPLVHGDPPNLTVGTSKPHIEQFAQAGCQCYGILIFPAEEALASIRQFGREIIPAFN